MKLDERIDADLAALAADSGRALPSLDDTARALDRARAERQGGWIMPRAKKPIWASAIALAVVGAVLLFPIPYTRHAGFLITMTSRDGRVAKLRVRSGDRAQAERRAAALAKARGAAFTVAAVDERAWGSVYAMAKEKLLHVDVELAGKTDAQVEAEIREQLAQAGWSAGAVEVQRDGDETRVSVEADSGEGGGDARHLRVESRTRGGEPGRVEFRALDIDREPGMSDEQLRAKVLEQLAARGLSGEVTVHDGKVEVRVTRKLEQP